MKIAILKEKAKGELRVAASPDSVERFVKLGCEVAIESDAGLSSNISNDDYKNAGAKVNAKLEILLKNADIVLAVNEPDDETLQLIPKNANLIAMLSPLSKKNIAKKYADANINAYAMELLPRISRAQSMDVLSSQSNLAGYRAVIDGVAELGKVLPMMMTAAGTIKPAKVLVLGAGVAGLQAVATAKRLGAIVSVFDVRPDVKEQVESLGGKFIEVELSASDEDGEDSAGYAKEMSEDYKQKQAALIADTVKSQDLVITTALIPNKPAPELITKEMVESMKSGAVIVDLAAINGGNCKLTKKDKVIEVGGVKIIGYTNIVNRCAGDASALYARNLFNFVSGLMINKDGKIEIDFEDEIIKAALITSN